MITWRARAHQQCGSTPSLTCPANGESGTRRSPDPAYGITQLRGDLDRFVFLLPGDDGESLPGPDPAAEAP